MQKEKIPPQQVFEANPSIGCDDWCAATGMSKRSFYGYRKRYVQDATAQGSAAQAEAAQDAAEVQRENVQRASGSSAIVQQSPAQSAVQRSANVQSSAAQSAVQDALGTSLVRSAQQRNALLFVVFSLATIASLKNMWDVVSTFEASTASIVAFTGVFSLAGVIFMLAGLKNKWTVSIVASLVVFEALCNASSIFGGLYDWRIVQDVQQPNQFLHRVHTLLHFVPAKNCAQAIAVFCASAIASVQFFAIKEIKPAPVQRKAKTQ